MRAYHLHPQEFQIWGKLQKKNYLYTFTDMNARQTEYYMKYMVMMCKSASTKFVKFMAQEVQTQAFVLINCDKGLPH